MKQTIEVKFDLVLPEEANADQIDEWLIFNLVGGAMENNNPLSRYDVEAEFSTLMWD